MMKSRKEPVSVFYEFTEKTEIPRVVIIRDRASAHAVMYRLEEMGAEEIQDTFDGKQSLA